MVSGEADSNFHREIPCFAVKHLKESKHAEHVRGAKRMRIEEAGLQSKEARARLLDHVCQMNIRRREGAAATMRVDYSSVDAGVSVPFRGMNAGKAPCGLPMTMASSALVGDTTQKGQGVHVRACAAKSWRSGGRRRRG